MSCCPSRSTGKPSAANWWGARGYETSSFQNLIDRYAARLMTVDDAADTRQFDDVPDGQQRQ